MDARAVAAAADLGTNTLNVWVARGLVPGMSIGKRGLRREFSLETATAVIVMAELTRFGFGAKMASLAAAEAMKSDARLLMITRPSERAERGDPDFAPPGTRVTFLSSDADVPKLLSAARQSTPLRSVFIIVDLETLAQKMRAAHDEWEQQHKTSEAQD